MVECTCRMRCTWLASDQLPTLNFVALALVSRLVVGVKEVTVSGLDRVDDVLGQWPVVICEGACMLPCFRLMLFPRCIVDVAEKEAEGNRKLFTQRYLDLLRVALSSLRGV